MPGPLDAGQYMYHLNRYHSNWGNPCPRCHRQFSDNNALDAHFQVNSCLDAKGVLDDATSDAKEVLLFRGVGAGEVPDSMRPRSTLPVQTYFLGRYATSIEGV